MRYFFPILFSIFIGKNFPATIEGNYFETYHGFGGANWHFEKDGTFMLSENNCEGGRKGRGVYTVDKDSIHLLFADYNVIKQKPEVQITKKDSASPGTEINFKLTDITTGEEIIFAVITACDSTGKNLATATSDMDGIAKISIQQYNGIIHLKTQYISYEKSEFLIEGTGTYDVKVMMASNFGPSYVAEGTQYDYKLLSIGKDKMVWQSTYQHVNYEIELTKK